MNNRNMIAITGNLGADPIIISAGKANAGTGKADADLGKANAGLGTETNTGIVVRMSIANTVGRFNKENKKFEETHTNWVPVTVFGSLAERALGGLKKGESITVFGALKVSTYKDKSGNNATGFEVIATDIMKAEILGVVRGASVSVRLGTDISVPQAESTELSSPAVKDVAIRPSAGRSLFSSKPQTLNRAIVSPRQN